MSNRVLFLGRKKYGAKALEWLVRQGWDVIGVVTDNDQILSPTAKIARKLGVKLYEYPEVCRKAAERSITFDLGVSYVYWNRIKPALIEIPKLGFVNFHPAPLPELKGTGGYNIAILEGHDSYGVSAHYVDKDIDTGPIIEVKRFPINSSNHTALSLEQFSHSKMLKLFHKTLTRVKEQGTLHCEHQTGGRYVTRDEMEALKDLQTNDDIEKKIRAFWYPPYDGARIEINGKRYTLINREILESLDGDENALFLHRQAT